MSDFDRFMAEAEAKSAQATASSSEGTLTEEEINEYWNELNDSAPDEDRKEVAALPAGDKDETSSGESSPVHAGAVALEESTPEPVAVSSRFDWGTIDSPKQSFFMALRQRESVSGDIHSHWEKKNPAQRVALWFTITGETSWPSDAPV